MSIYTVIAYFPRFGGGEELDVQANSAAEARTKATDLLNADYQPGWEIVEVIERPSAPGWTSLY